VENFNTSTNVEYGTGTGKCKKWDVHEISHETRGTYITVLYADRIPDSTNRYIYELLKSTKKVKIATDGGAIPPFKGSLGFVFADEDGKILLTCFGQPSGHDSLSFRSEICAFLAAVRLVTLITQYYDDILPCNAPVRIKIQVYTDSLSMIKKLKAYDKYPTAPLRH
jgi:hypothetical protein